MARLRSQSQLKAARELLLWDQSLEIRHKIPVFSLRMAFDKRLLGFCASSQTCMVKIFLDRLCKTQQRFFDFGSEWVDALRDSKV